MHSAALPIVIVFTESTKEVGEHGKRGQTRERANWKNSENLGAHVVIMECFGHVLMERSLRALWLFFETQDDQHQTHLFRCRKHWVQNVNYTCSVTHPDPIGCLANVHLIRKMTDNINHNELSRWETLDSTTRTHQLHPPCEAPAMSATLWHGLPCEATEIV